MSKAVKELQSKNQPSTDEKGVLEKLLEINENIAVIMASDMLFAGVDTVSCYYFIFWIKGNFILL